ncbi:hypothetical protein [Cellulomonas dongxiuzhuiae]|uniref:DUF805 domain-containing protein n=1 Tax=Cellulomonas dongxiuzhuiae TaxID=2819979 RepID=A0ABX8GKS3_9CELL|nr:hypothetical protein [Cellulomonas dongxiuzhuiae]MBO3096300.1 hypothetical protein [Cellulomonas dongxiuzhuiae]QWC16719.1 hypothetical protein KKR89_03460 [Cellulomonas dongxiuzhuiae]
MISSSTSGYDAGPGVGGIIAVALMAVLYVAVIAFGVYLYMRVARKAGWTLWHGLLMLVPLANVVFLIMFAFTEWPIERRLREAEARLAALGAGPYVDGPAGYPTGAYGGTGYGAPAYGAPVYGAPAYGAPAYGAPAYGVPSPGAPAYGDPGHGDPGLGAAPDAPGTPPGSASSPWAPPAAPPAPDAPR